MKVLSTEGLTKLIDLIKSSFISNEDTQATVAVDAVETTAVDAVETNVATLATVATTGSYNDLIDKPTVDQTYDGTSANAQSGVAVASAIAGRADTTLSNISNTSTKSIDGQWTNSYLLLANYVSRDNTSGTTAYSLSNYLPNDGYIYEVIVGGLCETSNTSGNFISIVVSSDIFGVIDVCSCRTRTASNVNTRGVTTIPIGTGRYVNLVGSTNSNYSGKVALAVYGYRRIGTNT